MKIKQKSVLFFIVLIAFIFPLLTVKADTLPQEPESSSPCEAPMFDARIEYTFQGFIVRGTFMEFPSDISLVQPLYSLDGEIYEICGVNWDLNWLGGDENALKKLHHQICLYSNQEPLKSYLEEKSDRFYLKLRLTRENGTTYETQTALIDRGSPQPIPKDTTAAAKFDSSMFVFESRPFYCYGRYQLTVSENATPEDIASYLPDTLPIEIQFENKNGLHLFTKGVTECPVTWKPLILPQLTAGETITLADAAEEIVVPAGTLLTTPTGIFRLNEPLSMDMDEVRLVLNVIAEGENPTGALSLENTGLEMAFHLKPTGATSIRAYTFSNGGTEWIEISGLPLLDAVNACPSVENSGYTLLLDNTCEPYQSYRAAADAGETPVPFLVGLKIEGGVYDGRQLILPWPDTYELPMKLPIMGGSGGNEGNAGSSNKNDSTPEGQRPNLPQNSQDNHDIKDPPQNSGSTPPAGKTPSKTDSSAKVRRPRSNTSVRKNKRQKQNQTSLNSASYIQPPANTSATNPPQTESKTAETDNKSQTKKASDTNHNDRTKTNITDSTNSARTKASATDTNNGSQAEATADAADGSKTETTTNTDNGSRTEMSSTDTDNSSGTETMTDADNNSRTEEKTADIKETSVLQEMPDRSTADKNGRALPPLAAAAAAGIGVGIAAGIRRLTGCRKSVRKVKHPAKTPL